MGGCLRALEQGGGCKLATGVPLFLTPTPPPLPPIPGVRLGPEPFLRVCVRVQTGTAEDYASRLVKEAKQYGIKALAADLEDYDMEVRARVHAQTDPQPWPEHGARGAHCCCTGHVA